MLKILTKPFCAPSARALRDELVKLTGKRIIITKDPKVIRGPFIRYGHAGKVPYGDTGHNSASFINLVANKAPFARLMEKNKIYSPIYHDNGKPNNFPVLIRKTLTGAGGSGIVVCKDEKSFDQHWKPGYVWTPFVKTAFELRVHILGGEIARVFKKIYQPEGKPEGSPEPDLPIRNLSQGYHFALRDLNKYPQLVELVKKIHPILGGSFYTLDIGWDKKTKKYFIFEANSGSGLNSETVKLYAEYLSKQLSKNE